MEYNILYGLIIELSILISGNPMFEDTVKEFMIVDDDLERDLIMVQSPSDGDRWMHVSRLENIRKTIDHPGRIKYCVYTLDNDRIEELREIVMEEIDDTLDYCGWQVSKMQEVKNSGPLRQRLNVKKTYGN